MPSRRDQITLSRDEQLELLEAERVVVVGSFGPRGWPHLMPLWYVPRDGELWGWTYAASQKVRNLERDPRATLQVETGEQYVELRGVMIRCETVIHRDLETVMGIGEELFRRYTGGAVGDDFAEAVRRQAAKRVGLQFVARSQATWDHRKLGGVY